eukprot:15483420-Alexandrium_andersonii.AAC.1
MASRGFCRFLRLLAASPIFRWRSSASHYVGRLRLKSSRLPRLLAGSSSARRSLTVACRFLHPRCILQLLAAFYRCLEE